MTWNHRVVRRNYPLSVNNETLYAIHEVYYGDVDEPHNASKRMMTQNPIAAVGESVEELRQVLEQMLRALDEPVLEYEDG